MTHTLETLQARYRSGELSPTAYRQALEAAYAKATDGRELACIRQRWSRLKECS